MPENHFRGDATLIWMTSGIFGVTIEEINPGAPIRTYNITRFIEIDSEESTINFKETHRSEGLRRIELGLTIIFGSTIIYQVAEHWEK